MLIQAHTFNSSLSNLFSCHRNQNNINVSSFDGISKTRLNIKKTLRIIASASPEPSSSSLVEKKRKVVEHISLLKAKEDLSEKEEKDMLDFLYTTQYQMSGILSISLGRISNQNDDNYTHAVYIRFQKKEELEKFYTKPFYLGVLKEYVLPHCHGMLNLDYESEVEDDILSIFRKGEEFNYGVEFMLLISFLDDATKPINDALNFLQILTTEFPSLIVQATQGRNFNPSNEEFSHAVVIRFRSLDALQIFEESSEYKNIWKTKFESITRKTLSLYFLVDPVGSELMPYRRQFSSTVFTIQQIIIITQRISPNIQENSLPLVSLDI